MRKLSLSLVAVAWVLALLAASGPVAEAAAGASARIANFDRGVIGDTSGPHGAPAVAVDTDGNAVDAHDGILRYFGGRYYWYGTAYRCGYALWGLTGDLSAPPRFTFCGLAAYSSSDLVTWRDEGYLFDATTPYWQATCATGCFSPKVLFDPRRKRYVLWVNMGVVRGQTTYRVLTSASPAGPFGDVKVPSLDVREGGDYDIFVDRDGKGWIAETDARTRVLHIVVQELSSDYTDGVGASVQANQPTPDLSCARQTFCGLREAPSLFRRGDFYYLTVSNPACPYCQAGTSYYMARRPNGPWKGPGPLSVSTPQGATGAQQGESISADSCGGQPRSVSELPSAAGSVYLYWSDLWRGITDQISAGGPFPQHASNGNQALAGRFVAPLRFSSDGTIAPIRCTAISKVPLAEGHAAPPRPAAYQTACAIGAGRGVRQELRSIAQPTSGVRVTLYKFNDPDAALSYKISGSRGSAPAAVRGELLAASLGSAPASVVLPISAKANTPLTLTLNSSSRRGCYGVLLAHAPKRDAGSYTGPVAKSIRTTRVVRILATARPRPAVAATLAVAFKAGPRGARVTRFGVSRLPARAMVTLRCKARRAGACGFRRLALRGRRSVSLLYAFKRRTLPLKTVIELTVTAPGHRATRTRWTVASSKVTRS